MSLKGLSSSTEESGQSWIITTSLYDGPYTNEKYAQFHLNILNPSQELITDYKNAYTYSYYTQTNPKSIALLVCRIRF